MFDYVWVADDAEDGDDHLVVVALNLAAQVGARVTVCRWVSTEPPELAPPNVGRVRRLRERVLRLAAAHDDLTVEVVVIGVPLAAEVTDLVRLDEPDLVICGRRKRPPDADPYDLAPDVAEVLLEAHPAPMLVIPRASR